MLRHTDMGLRCSGRVGGGGGLRGVLWVLLVVLIVTVFLLQSVDAKKRKDGDRENWRISPKHRWTKRHRKASECRLGGKRYALEDTWSPDLGPPFGVWYCVKCHCQKVVRKRRIVGKVKCENIKSTCPQVLCRDPVLLPGACCKVCPAPDTPSPMSQEEPIDELPNGNHFAVLLNGRTSQSPLTTSLVATGRLAYRRKTLHFSFLLPDGTPSPASVQFLHENGDILEELEAQPTPYEATNNRMCGTWTKVPRDYRALLRDEKLWVALVPASNSTEDTISGLVSRYSGVDSEVFSALLVPAKPTSQPLLKGGGTAIISVSAPTDSLHISLVFNGVFLPEDTHNITLVIELIPSRAVEPVVETVRLNKVFTDVNRVEVMTTLGDEGLRLLARGRVEMRVWSTTAEDLVLEGIITPRATCNVFSAVLTPPIAPTSLSSATSSDTSYVVTKGGELMTNQLEKKVIIGENPEDDGGAYGAVGRYNAGWAVMTLSNDGAFDYQVFIKGLTGQVAKLTLERVVRRKKSRMVEDITSTFEDGWANGTYDKPTYRDMEALLQGQLQVRVETNEIGEKLKGSLVPVAVTEALRSTWPILLSSPASPLAATAWVAVDAACVLHYDVIVSGDMPDGARDPTWSLRLREEDNKWDPRFEQNNIILEEAVTGRDISSHMTELSRISLSRLNAGVTHLDLVLLPNEQTWNDTVTTNALPTLSGLVKGIQVPTMCVHPPHSGGSYSNPVTCDPLQCVLDPVADVDTPTYRCIDDDKKVHEDGQSWTNPLDLCSRCMCTKGRIHCDPVICPNLPSTCTHSVTLPGECCPSCDVGNHVTPEGDVKGCNLSNTFHAAGTQWHPYLPPNGFDKCVVCICNATTLDITCPRKECPPLACPQKAAYYPAKTSCCKKCPPPPVASLSTALLPSDTRMTEEERNEWRLRHGGCVRSNKIYDNGQEWHPRVFPAGVFKCVTCLCKDSVITCSRKTCPKLSCHTKVSVADECCHRCADNYTTRRTGPLRKTGRKGNNRKSKKGYYKKNSSEIATVLSDHNYRYSKSAHRSGYSNSRWMGKQSERARTRRGE